MAGVSLTTASRVFNRHPYVSDKIRRRVFDAAAKLDYTPKLSARRDTVAVIVGLFDQLGHNVYEATMLSRIMEEALRARLNVEIVPMGSLETLEESFIRAAVVMTYSGSFEKDLERVGKRIPLITLNNIVPGYGYVCSDHYDCVVRAAEHLIMSGHRDIGILFSPSADNMSWGENMRLEGYKAALEKHGIPFRRELVSNDGRRVLENLGEMAFVSCPTALIVCGESMALPCWHALRLLGKRIPEDISAVLFDSPAITPYLTPRPSVIKQNFQALGKAAVEAMISLLRGDSGTPAVTLPVEFIPGQSVRDLSLNTNTESVK